VRGPEFGERDGRVGEARKIDGDTRMPGPDERLDLVLNVPDIDVHASQDATFSASSVPSR
jgi:hypothetical protein